MFISSEDQFFFDKRRGGKSLVRHFLPIKWFGGVVIDVIFIEAIFPNKFSVAVRSSAVNSLEQEELELNAL